MATAPLTITVRLETGPFLVWLRAMRLAAYVVGPDRALRAAEWGARHLLLVKFGERGRWRVLKLEE